MSRLNKIRKRIEITCDFNFWGLGAWVWWDMGNIYLTLGPLEFTFYLSSWEGEE